MSPERERRPGPGGGVGSAGREANDLPATVNPPSTTPPLPTAANATGPQATPKAGAPLAAALARCPEPPPTSYRAVCVSWRRIHFAPGEPTRRRTFDNLEDAVAFRQQLERPEKEHGQGAALVRIDVAYSARDERGKLWVEYADDFQRPEAWHPRPRA